MAWFSLLFLKTPEAPFLFFFKSQKADAVCGAVVEWMASLCPLKHGGKTPGSVFSFDSEMLTGRPVGVGGHCVPPPPPLAEANCDDERFFIVKGAPASGLCQSIKTCAGR